MCNIIIHVGLRTNFLRVRKTSGVEIIRTSGGQDQQWTSTRSVATKEFLDCQGGSRRGRVRSCPGNRRTLQEVQEVGSNEVPGVCRGNTTRMGHPRTRKPQWGCRRDDVGCTDWSLCPLRYSHELLSVPGRSVRSYD